MINIEEFYKYGFSKCENIIIDYKRWNYSHDMILAKIIASLDSIYTDDINRIKVIETNLYNDMNKCAFLFRNNLDYLHLISLNVEKESILDINSLDEYKNLYAPIYRLIMNNNSVIDQVIEELQYQLSKNHYNPKKLFKIPNQYNESYRLEFDISEYIRSDKDKFIEYVNNLKTLILSTLNDKFSKILFDSLTISLSIEHSNIEDFLDMENINKKILITKKFLDEFKKFNDEYHNRIWNKLLQCIYNEKICISIVDNKDSFSYVSSNSINKATGYINLSTLIDRDKKIFDFEELRKLVKRSVYYLDLLTSLFEDNNNPSNDIQLDLIGFEEVIRALDIKDNQDVLFTSLCNDIYKYVSISALEASINIVDIFGKDPCFYDERLNDFNSNRYYLDISSENIEKAYILMNTYKDELPKELVDYLTKVYITYSPITFQYLFHNIVKNNIRNSKRIASTHSGCQVKDTYINTSKGLLRLDEIGNINDNTEQWLDINIDIEQEQDYTKSDKFYINGLKDTKKITLSSGIDLECTLNHQYRVLDKNDQYVWKQADQLEKGDRIVYKIGEYTNTENPVFDFSDFKKKSTYSSDITFPNEMNEDLAYFIGVYYDKGHKDKSRLNIPFVKKDIEKFNKFKEIVKRLFNYDLKIDESKRDSTIITYIYSSEIIQKLELIGVLKGNSKTISIPRIIRQSSKSCILSFIEGYRNIDKNNKYINTSSYQFAKELLILMRMIGINGHVYKFSNRKDNEVKYVLYRVTIGGYSSDDFDESKIKFMPKEIQKEHLLLLSYGNKLYTDKIVNIEDSQNYTYDIQVPINNTYIANSYISHNTISDFCSVVNTDEAFYKYDNEYVDEVTDRTIKLCNVSKDSILNILEKSYGKVNEIYFEPCNDEHNHSCDININNDKKENITLSLEEILKNVKTEELVTILQNNKHIYNKLFASFVSSGRANTIIREDSDEDTKPLYGIGSFITCGTPYGILNISSKFDNMDRMKEVMIMFNHPDTSFRNLIDTLVVIISNFLQENYNYKVRYNKLIHSLRYKYSGLEFEYNSIIQNDKIKVYSIPDLLSYVIPDMEYLYLLNKYGTVEKVSNRIQVQ